jgi:hypothetical protein
MAVQVGRLSKLIGEIDTDGIARTNPQRGADVLAAESVALDLRTGHSERRRLDVERGSQLPVRRLQLDGRLEREPLLSGEGRRHALISGDGARSERGVARWRGSGCGVRCR